MTAASEPAYQLQAQAEGWQALVARQHEIVLRLRQLTSDQLEVAELWRVADAGALADQARSAANAFRALSTELIGLEQTAVDMVTDNIAAAAQLLRPS